MMKLLLSVSLLSCAIASGEASGQAIFRNAHDLFVQTIQNDKAQGIMTGEIAEHFTRQFKSTGSLFVEARVIAKLKPEHCRRLELIMRKSEVATPTGNQDVVMTSQMNYCLNGKPPVSSEGG